MAREFEANELMSLPQKNGLGKYWEQRCLNVTDTVACKRKASTSERVVKSQRMYPETSALDVLCPNARFVNAKKVVKHLRKDYGTAPISGRIM